MAVILTCCLILLFTDNGQTYNQLVIPGKTQATSSSFFGHSYFANNTVDGDFRQDIKYCSHTSETANNAWLRVDLRKIYSIKNVKFWYRNDNGKFLSTERLRGYSIRVSNDSNVPPSKICYTDPGNVTLPTVINQDCERTSRYVWFYQTHNSRFDLSPILEICEVQVFGCDTGRFSVDCSNTCNHCKNTARCGIERGECDNLGCAVTGFRPLLCADCTEGKYGPLCENQCGHCFGSNVCFHINGSCPGNCSDGYIGEKCTDACERGRYGPSCQKKCGHCFGSDVCFHVNGSCPGNCSDGFVGGRCSDIIQQTQFREESHNAEVIAVPVVVFIVVISIVCVILFLQRRKKTQRPVQKLDEEHVYYLPDNLTEDKNEYEELKSADYATTYKRQTFQQTNVPINSAQDIMEPIMIIDLLGKIHELKQDSELGFKRQFDAIAPYLSECSCSIGKRRENASKNRYPTILPYDHSRVILMSTNNDYINANYIKNTSGKQVYIATQESTSKKMFDFWLMLWQEEIYVIVMVKGPTNNTKEYYLPNSSNHGYERGKFLIQLMSEKTYSHFKKHKIQITNKESRENRQITHLEFTAWPKQGTPHPLELVVFYHYVSRAMEKYPENKLLAQCSTGTGPSAMIIALDALYKHGLITGMIKVAEFVTEMRKDRMDMIQNLGQYICLHYVLHECFRAKCFVMNKETFLAEGKLPKIKEEFNMLLSIRQSSVTDENTSKKNKETEYENITSSDEQIVPDSFCLDVLNAVIISSFTTRDCIIAGRYPSHGEAVDLIELLINQKCTTLVSINPVSDVPYSNEWYSQLQNLSQYQVEVIPGARISKHITLSTLRMKMTSNWHQITLYEMASWKFTEILPLDVEAILDVIKFIQIEKHVTRDTKLIILSRDGATGCGVFCVVYNAIQQLQQDEEVDMFTIVRQLQSRRPEMISEMNEYLFCYEALKSYIDEK